MFFPFLQRPSLSQTLGVLLLTMWLAFPTQALAVVAPQAPAQTEAKPQTTAELQPTILEPGKPIEREIKGQETHQFAITLQAGQFVQFTVEQYQINIAFRLIFPPPGPTREIDTVQLFTGSEKYYLLVEMAGNYQIEMFSNSPSDVTGRYRVVSEVRPPTEKDLPLAAAQKLGDEGFELMNKQTKETNLQAIDKYLAAQALFHDNGEKHLSGWFLVMAGFTFDRLGNYQKGSELYQKAQEEARSIDDLYIEQLALGNSASGLILLGDPRKGRSLYFKLIEVVKKTGDFTGEGNALLALGRTYTLTGDHGKSIEYYRQAFELGQRVNNPKTKMIAMSNLGLAYNFLGANQKGFECYKQAMEWARFLDDKRMEGIILNNIGGVYQTLGDDEHAIEYFTKARDIWQLMGNRSLIGNAIDNLGGACQNLKNPTKALEFFNQSLELRKSLGDKIGTAGTFQKIGTTYLDLNDNSKAEEFLKQALALHKENGNRQEEASTLVYLGNLESKVDHFDSAKRFYEQALGIQREINDQVRQTRTYYWLAATNASQKDFLKAKEHIETALKLAEAIRSQVAVKELRTTYFAQYRKFYDLYIHILMQLDKLEPAASFAKEALFISEQARARTLLELLNEAQTNFRQGVEANLIEREKGLKNQIGAKSDLMFKLITTKGKKSEIEQFEKEISALAAELEQTRAEIRQKSPRYAALTQPQPLKPAEIQQLLDPDTLLLEYALGGKKGYLWAVTQTEVTSYQLNDSPEIEAQARKVYELLSKPKVVNRDVQLSKAQRQQELAAAEAAYHEAAGKLSEMILGPVAAKLGSKRLVIVADGALQYIPFGALPKPQGSEIEKTQNKPFKAPNLTPLVIDHEIVNLPSASSLAIQRRQLTERKPAEKHLAVLADPVFQSDDPRLQVAAKSKPAVPKETAQTIAKPNESPAKEETEADREIELSSSKLKQTAQETNFSETELVIPRLRFTREEAQSISKLVPPAQVKAALDWEANRILATSGELAKYRIVHFATHGFLNSQHPELSGIVLSLVDENGKPQDGFVRMVDVFNLNLPADLVVLSACQTGLGKEIKGEGVQGLSRAFMYAGAERVVVSLWNVNDKATSELMTHFYKNMFTGKQRPAAALRAAQLEMWKTSQWKSPFYWAPFVLQGEWR